MVRHALRVVNALLQNVFFSSGTRLLVDRSGRAAISPTGRNSPSRAMGKGVGEASYDRPDIRAYVRFKDEFDAPWTSGRLRELEARVGIEPTHKAFAEPCLTTWLPRREKVRCKIGHVPSRASATLAKTVSPGSPSAISIEPRAYRPEKPRRWRLSQSSCGLKIPAGVIMPVINSEGVTSKPGLRAPLPGFATRT